MKNSKMSRYLRQELWIERVEETIEQWENLQGVKVPEDIKDTIVKFMRGKIKRGIEKNTLSKMFMQVAVTALIYIKMNKTK